MHGNAVGLQSLLCHPQILGELKRWRRVLGMLIATPSEAASRGRKT